MNFEAAEMLEIIEIQYLKMNGWTGGYSNWSNEKYLDRTFDQDGAVLCQKTADKLEIQADIEARVKENNLDFEDSDLHGE